MTTSDPSTNLHIEAEVEALRHENAAMRSELDQLHSSLRMRAASLLASLATPRGWLDSPKNVWSLGREILAVRRWRRLVLGLECGLPDDELRRTEPGPGTQKHVKALSCYVFANANAVAPVIQNNDQAINIATSRVTELSRLARSGPDWPAPALSAHKPGLKRRTLMALHTGQPDQTNGYARRSHEILMALRALDWDAQAALRDRTGTTDISGTQAELYHRIGPVSPNDPGLDAYVNAYSDALFCDIQRQRPSLVHAASNHVTGRAAAIAARRAALPFVYEIRGLWEVTRQSVEPAYAEALGYRAQRRMEIETARIADKVLVNGEAIADLFRQAGIAGDKIINIPNGIRRDSLPAEADVKALKSRWGLDDRPIIGFAGSVTAYEGLRDLFAACAQLDDIPFHLLMIGDGPELSALNAEAARLGLRERITWTGRVAPEDVTTAYGFIDIAPLVRKDSPVTRLVPPLKPLDAMAGRAALIVSDLPPLAEFAAEGRGVIVPPESPLELAAALRNLLQDDQARSRMTASAFDWITANRTWDKIAGRISDVYDELLAP